MGLKVVLLTESNSLNQDVPLPYKYHGQLWATIQTIVSDLNYRCEIVELHKLDFEEEETINKFLNADIVIMDITNQDRRPTFMYHKGNRENIDCMDDLVLIQSSGVENDSDIRDLKIKRLIVYQYDEKEGVFLDTTIPATNSPPLLKESLENYLQTAADNIQKDLADRYIARINSEKVKDQHTTVSSNFLWKEICDEIVTEANQKHVTPKLIIQLMYAFRDIQDYDSMIRLNQRCQHIEEIENKMKNNMMFSYLTAFALSRRNEPGDCAQALIILDKLSTMKSESESNNDITCLYGRIYKDQYRESGYEDQNSLNKAIEWYQRSFSPDPNIHAGINLLVLLCIKVDDVKHNPETYRIILLLNTLLGKKGRSLKDQTDYWDVATYFALHAIQRDWRRACQAALHMYWLHPPIWYLKSTLNDLKILHQAILIRDNKKPRDKKTPMATTEEDIYNFWIDFFNDAIGSNSTSSQAKGLPAQIPILIRDNCQRKDGTGLKTVYIEAHLQLNFDTGTEPETLVIRTVESKQHLQENDSGMKIEMDSIRSIINGNSDQRSVFLHAYENSEGVPSVEFNIFFSSSERRTQFNEKMSQHRAGTNNIEVDEGFDLEFERHQNGPRIVIGRGSSGIVYRAQDRITGKKFAVKEIPMRDSTRTNEVKNEIKNLSRLNHKNIIKYYGTAIDRTNMPTVFQIIMDFVDGESLSERVSRGPFMETTISSFTRQILEGIQYLHENQIMHRDIKSKNIIVNSKGEIKIVDFGTSKRLAGLHLSVEDDVQGTAHYMSPEMLCNSPLGYGLEVDIWSVGCTVIEMATGKMPFHTIPNPWAVMSKLRNDKQPPDIPSNLSDNAKDFLAKCFELTDERLSAKDLLNHPFIKMRGGLPRETSSDTNSRNDDRSPRGDAMHVSDSRSSFQRDIFEEDESIFEPAHDLETQVSTVENRRTELITFLQNLESREHVLGEWMTLIEETNETEIIKIEKLRLLLLGISQYLVESNERPLREAIDQICDKSMMTTDSRTDLERAFYLFTKATSTVLVNKNDPPSHVLFALENISRRVAERLVGLIRSDFIPAATISSSTLNSLGTHTSLPVHVDGVTNNEITRLYQQYSRLSEANKEQFRRLINLESENGNVMTERVEHQQDISSETADVFVPVEISPTSDNIGNESVF